MDLGLSPEQELLQRTAREFLETECPRTVVRAMERDPLGYPPALWSKIAELGWIGLPFPERYGGADGSLVDLVVLAEELGRALAPLPYHATIVAGLAILEAGSEDQCADYLPRIARGELIATIAHLEPGRGHEPEQVSLRAEPADGGYRLNGTKVMVDWAHVADEILVLARTSPGAEHGLTLFLVPRETPGVTITPLQTIAECPTSEVVFDGAWIPAGRVLGPVDGGWLAWWPARQRAIIARCGEMTGGATVAHQMSVEYAKQRVAFGRPIGAFQAIQHKLVEMQNDLDGMRLATLYAAWTIDDGRPADYWVSTAKAQASDGYRLICFEGHEIHAGIGFMREFDLQLYFRRAKVAELDYGDGVHHRRELARMLKRDPTLGRI